MDLQVINDTFRESRQAFVSATVSAFTSITPDVAESRATNYAYDLVRMVSFVFGRGGEEDRNVWDKAFTHLQAIAADPTIDNACRIVAEQTGVTEETLEDDIRALIENPPAPFIAGSLSFNGECSLTLETGDVEIDGVNLGTYGMEVSVRNACFVTKFWPITARNPGGEENEGDEDDEDDESYHSGGEVNPSGVIHPHISDQSLCTGTGEAAYVRMSRSGALFDFVALVGTHLLSYHPPGAYALLRSFSDIARGPRCSYCGGVFYDEETKVPDADNPGRFIHRGCATVYNGVFHNPNDFGVCSMCTEVKELRSGVQGVCADCLDDYNHIMSRRDELVYVCPVCRVQHQISDDMSWGMASRRVRTTNGAVISACRFCYEREETRNRPAGLLVPEIRAVTCDSCGTLTSLSSVYSCRATGTPSCNNCGDGFFSNAVVRERHIVEAYLQGALSNALQPLTFDYVDILGVSLPTSDISDENMAGVLREVLERQLWPSRAPFAEVVRVLNTTNDGTSTLRERYGLPFDFARPKEYVNEESIRVYDSQITGRW